MQPFIGYVLIEHTLFSFCMALIGNDCKGSSRSDKGYAVFYGEHTLFMFSVALIGNDCRGCHILIHNPKYLQWGRTEMPIFWR